MEEYCFNFLRAESEHRAIDVAVVEKVITRFGLTRDRIYKQM